MVDQELKHCISGFQFDRAFIDVLGWKKFKHLSRVELPDIGRMPPGWKTRQLRARIEAAPKLQFFVRGIASLAPQIVLHCTAESGRYIPGLLRDRIARELARLHYRPIVIFSSAELQCQDWCLPIRIGSGISTVHYPVDGHAAIRRLAEALCDLEITGENFEALQSHLEVYRRIDILREALACESDRDDGLRFAMKFARFGDHVIERAKRAYSARVWEVSRQIEIAQRAKAGCRESFERFYEMHQYLVFERAREFLKNKQTFISEFEDYVGAGNVGVGRGFINYDPGKPFAPSTLVFHHIDKHISRAFGRLELPLWVPVHVQSVLLQSCWRESAVFDSMAQSQKRTPSDAELLANIGLDEDDVEVYQRFRQRRLWENRVSIDDLDPNQDISELAYQEAFDQRDDLRQLEAYARLQSIPYRHSQVLALRVGLHPLAKGDALSLEEVSDVVHLTRERVRQVQLRAIEMAQKVEIPPIDPPWTEPEPRSGRARPEIGKLPPPGRGVESANQYVDFLLARVGLEAEPLAVHQAMMEWFPKSSLKIERIIRKLEVMKGECGKGKPYDLVQRDSVGSFLPMSQPTLQPVPFEEPVEPVRSIPPSPPATVRKANECVEPICSTPPSPPATVRKANEHVEPICSTPPRPPYNVRKANDYVEHILDTYGCQFCSRSLHRAMLSHFPKSIITESQIRDKFRRRGWSQ